MLARIRAVWGHLVGDAVGVPYEFQPSDDRLTGWGFAASTCLPDVT